MSFLRELNDASPADFVAMLEGIYEHSPWVPERVLDKRPFGSAEELHEAMRVELIKASPQDQLALLRAHPQLIGRVSPNSLTAASLAEQASVGLNRSSEQQAEELRQLNRVYSERFGFPFIVAVRGLSREEIVAKLKERIESDPVKEFSVCLDQVVKIAWSRLEQRIHTES